MYRMLFVVLFVFSATAFSDSVTQTDWSGGPGVFGPVTTLGTDFYWDTDVSWWGVPGGMTCEHISRYDLNGSFDAPNFIVSGDIDGDGDHDLASAMFSGSSRFMWWENTGGAAAEMIPHSVSAVGFSGVSCVQLDDVDGDGWTDIIGAASGSDAIAWFRNNDGSGTAWTKNEVVSGYDGAESVHPVDIDDDGDMDLLGAALTEDDISWFENTGGPGIQWTRHSIDGSFDGAMSVCDGDLDGDGDPDILGAAYSGNTIAWWENTDGSGGSWTKRTIASDVTGATCVLACDVNGDGHLDVLAAPRWGTGFSWWENDGNTPVSWTEHPVTSEEDGYIHLYPADMDNDGDMDIASAAYVADMVEWWENLDGSGTAWEGHLVQNHYQSPMSVCCDDLNSDTVPEIFSCSYSHDFVSEWNLTEYSPVGSFESSYFDTQASPAWDSIDWDAVLPGGSTLGVALRTTSDLSSPGEWSDTLYEPGPIDGILASGDRYIQYAVIMTTPDPDATPVLNELSISWDPLGVQETSMPVSFQDGLTFQANPSSSPVARFRLTESSWVTLTVFDLTGRMVTTRTVDYPAGEHSVQLNELPPGMYACRMTWEESSVTERFVVVGGPGHP